MLCVALLLHLYWGDFQIVSDEKKFSPLVYFDQPLVGLLLHLLRASGGYLLVVLLMVLRLAI